MKAAISITKENIEGIVKELDNSKYFLLDNSNASRAELFNFALALGLNNGTPTPLSTSVSFIRTSYIENILYQYKSIFFDKELSTHISDIDEITDTDKALYLVEQYANTGFSILAKMKTEYPDEKHFMMKLLNELERTYNKIIEDDQSNNNQSSQITEDHDFIHYTNNEDASLPKAAEKGSTYGHF
jgi:hypothetical protein